MKSNKIIRLFSVIALLILLSALLSIPVFATETGSLTVTSESSVPLVFQILLVVALIIAIPIALVLYIIFFVIYAIYCVIMSVVGAITSIFGITLLFFI